jgi:predicted alpha/beta hydrolase family esterase
MKTSEADILIIPGWSSSGPDHWQTRWEKNLKTARRVEQADWFKPGKDQWTARIVEAVAQSVRPVVLVGHSLGVMAIAHAAQKLARLPAIPGDLQCCRRLLRTGADGPAAFSIGARRLRQRPLLLA